MSTLTAWTHTHNARPSLPPCRVVKVCLDPLSGEYLTRSEWRKVYAGGTPDLPPNRYSRVVPA